MVAADGDLAVADEEHEMAEDLAGSSSYGDPMGVVLT